MRSKKRFIFDEEAEAEKIIQDGFPDGKIDYGKMYIVAKYFREKYNLGEIKLEKKIIDFCKKQNKTFNPVLEIESIKKWVKSAMLYGLRKIEAIEVSKKEIDFLKTITIDKERKIMFSILIIAKALKQRNSKRKKGDIKASPNYYFRYSNFSDIIAISGVKNITEILLADIIGKYSDYFYFYNPERELIRVEFIDPCPEKTISITDFDNISQYYRDIFGINKNIIKCEICGKEILKSGNKQKMCKECSMEVRKEQKRIWIKNARKNVDK